MWGGTCSSHDQGSPWLRSTSQSHTPPPTCSNRDKCSGCAREYKTCEVRKGEAERRVKTRRTREIESGSLAFLTPNVHSRGATVFRPPTFHTFWGASRMRAKVTVCRHLPSQTDRFYLTTSLKDTSVLRGEKQFLLHSSCLLFCNS